MSFLDKRLTAIAGRSLDSCTTVSNALAEVFSSQGRQGGVSLSLQSRYGALIAYPENSGGAALDICSHPLLVPLAAGEKEERIALLLGPETWYMVSCFSLSGIAFYPAISIPAPPDRLRWVRYEMLAALDCFHLNCRECIAAFLADMTFRPWGAVGEKRGAPEKRLLETLAAYSGAVEAAALVDGDGFVLLAAGEKERAEAVAGTLALFSRQAVQDLDDLGGMDVRSVSVGGGDRTFLYGRVPRSAVSLAFSVRGARSPVVARFLFDAGIAAMPSLRDLPETLGDYRGSACRSPAKTRDGWLSGPRLVPQGAFVSIKDGGDFHGPECAIVLNANATSLHWHPSRADAVKAGLAPCPACNP